MHKTTLEQWRMFKSVAETGGFNQASDVIHKSPSTIHHAVRKLEDTLGTSLFKVSNRKAQLTPQGEILLERSYQLISELTRIESLAEDLSKGITISVKIGLDRLFPRNLISRLVHNLMEANPNIDLDIQYCSLSQAQQLFKERKLDVFASCENLTGTQSTELGQFDYHLVAHARHPIFHEKDLSHYREILVRHEPEYVCPLRRMYQSHQTWRVDDYDMVKSLVLDGKGYAWLPAPLIKQELKQGLLKPLITSFDNRQSLSFIMHHVEDKNLSPVIDSFKAACLHKASSTAPSPSPNHQSVPAVDDF